MLLHIELTHSSVIDTAIISLNTNKQTNKQTKVLLKTESSLVGWWYVRITGVGSSKFVSWWLLVFIDFLSTRELTLKDMNKLYQYQKTTTTITKHADTTKHNTVWYMCIFLRMFCTVFYVYLDGLVPERRNSIANALELRLSCTNPFIYNMANFSSFFFKFQNPIYILPSPLPCCIQYHPVFKSFRLSDAYMHQ